MKTVVILAGNEVMTSQVVGVMDFFMICNKYWQVRNQTPHSQLFDVVVVSPTGEALISESGVSIPAQNAPPIEQVDAIVMTAGVAYDRPSVEAYFSQVASFRPYLRQANSLAIPIAAFCSGTFVLAQMDLLDARAATTVWWLAPIFKQCFPKVYLTLEQLVVKDEHFFTAGANTAYLSLCLSLLAHLYSPALANQVAKLLLVDPNRTSQMPYMSLQVPEQHGDELVRKIQSWMYKNMQSRITLDDISAQFAITKRTLNRRFKKALDDTPVNYLQRMRVEEAKRLLESSEMTLESITYRVGYEDVSSFRKLFTEVAELTPRAYRDKFQPRLR